MKIQLHVLTRSLETSKLELLEAIRRQPDLEVRMVDLTVPQPDYRELVEAIFAADSVVTW
ncbi:MAG: hypothetical protein FJ379_15390 [Verrucomicrobia bacterium]|nr:hypothetical protein [Verrucomicrobiota bacterium]